MTYDKLDFFYGIVFTNESSLTVCWKRILGSFENVINKMILQFI